MEKWVFLSHIHEEAKLANEIKRDIEKEFSGFVKVFVSSDGDSIPKGTNFLKRIEDRLLDCVGALYLISPASVKRNWINFELGAVWIRNLINEKKGKQEIPTIPMCHSGITPAILPMPLSSLNAIQLNNEKELKEAFKSIQKAVQGSGELKTNFKLLAKKVVDFEKSHAQTAIYIQDLHHVSLAIRNLSNSRPFYDDFLKLTPKNRPDRNVFNFDGLWYYLPNGRELHLVENKSGTFREERVLFPKGSPPDSHFAFSVSSDVYIEIHGEAQRLGIPHLFEPYPGLKQLYLLDPDNHIIEITTKK